VERRFIITLLWLLK